jgi:hypothetical protein
MQAIFDTLKTRTRQRCGGRWKRIGGDERVR